VVDSGATHHFLADEAAVEDAKATYLMVTLGDGLGLQARGVRIVTMFTVAHRVWLGPARGHISGLARKWQPPQEWRRATVGIAHDSHPDEPAMIQETLTSPAAEYWQQAMTEELQ
jgi:hypothetical protein